MVKRAKWEESQVRLLADLYEENASVLEDEATAAITMKRKRECRKMIAERVSALEGPVWDAESITTKIK